MKTYDEMLTLVREVASRNLDIDISTIKPESRFVEDLDADSLSMIEMILSAEERMEIDIPDQDIDSLTTVDAATKYLVERMKDR